MRKTPTTIAAGVVLAMAIATPAFAQVSNPSQLLQGLMSGNQAQDNTVRDAFERGYRRGREDQQRADRDRGDPQLDRRGYPEQDRNQGSQRTPYSR